MERGGRNGPRGGRGGRGGGGNRGNPGNPQQSRPNSWRDQGNNSGGGRPTSGGGTPQSQPQAWPSLGRGSGQAPATNPWGNRGASSSSSSGISRQLSGNDNNNGRPNVGNTQQTQAPAWPRLAQAPGQAPPPRPLGVPQNVNAPPMRQNPNSADNRAPRTDERPSTSSGNGSGQVVAEAREEHGRGNARGKRVISDDFSLNTKPSGMVSKCGTSGRQITLTTNYFCMVNTPKWTVHQYRVDFSPEVENIRVRRAYLAQHKDRFHGYIFDGTMMFTVTFIPEAQQGIEIITRNRENETILIKIKHVGIVERTDIQMCQVLNLIMRRAIAGLNLQLVGRNFFDPVAKIGLSQYHMEIWPGYITSIRQHERDLLMVCEIAHKVMRTDNLLYILSQCSKEHNPQDAFKHRVVGSIVLTDYTNKFYRIDDVDFSLNPKSTFETRDGPISYAEYYKKRYNIIIRELRQPLLVSRPTEKDIRGGETRYVMLVPELSRATGMTDEMRSDFRLMRAMSDHTRLNPERRIDRLKAFSGRLLGTRESVEVLNSWNMKMNSQLIETPARILPPGRILFGNNVTHTCRNDADWTKECKINKMLSTKNINNWVVICPSKSMRDVQNFVQMCMRVGTSMGVVISSPKYFDIPDDRNQTYARTIEVATQRDPQILMVTIPRNNAEKYSCIKKKTCVDNPIPSQVCTLTTIAPRPEKMGGLMSIATKVVIQMNAKLKGAPWAVDLPVKEAVMFAGFDVCHSAKDKNKSYGALVTTMDTRRSTRFFSKVMEHLKGQELTNAMALNMTMALRAYKDEHGHLPERIFFYRDGVGDGQLHQVVHTELNHLRKKIEEVYSSANLRCRLTFIVVSKRINTRFFYNSKNPEPGTVVDDVVTLPDRYDFFIVSQSVRQGTVSPTSYNIIHDTSGYSADVIQKITYAQTHMYYNWSGTCRVPAVCQYAHKLAALVAEHIFRDPSNSLEQNLYFL